MTEQMIAKAVVVGRIHSDAHLPASGRAQPSRVGAGRIGRMGSSGATLRRLLRVTLGLGICLPAVWAVCPQISPVVVLDQTAHVHTLEAATLVAPRQNELGGMAASSPTIPDHLPAPLARSVADPLRSSSPAFKPRLRLPDDYIPSHQQVHTVERTQFQPLQRPATTAPATSHGSTPGDEWRQPFQTAAAQPPPHLSPPQPSPLPQPPVNSGPGTVPQGSSTTPTASDNQLTFNFKDAPWSLVLSRFADESGLSLQVGSELPSRTFTYFDRNRYTVTEALDVLNDHLLREGFLAVRTGRHLFVLSDEDPIPDNLVSFVESSQLSALGRNELASIAIPIVGTQPLTAAKEVEELLSPFGVVTPLSNSRSLVVTDTGGYLRRIYHLMTSSAGQGGGPSFVYQLKNSPAEEVAKAINDFLTNQDSQTPNPIPSRNQPQVTSQLVVVAEKTTNSILARGTAEQLQRIQDLIVQLDHSPDQVLIQALLVEVELGNLDEFGVEIGVQDSVLFDRSVIDELVTINETNTSPNGVQTTSQRIISQTSNPGFNFNNQALGNNTAVRPSTIGAQALSNLAMGRVNGDLQFGGLVLSAGSESVNVLLRALAANHKVDVLSRPQVRTLHNKEALIQIGKQVPVVDGVSVTAVGSANPIIRQDQSGIILKVTPKVSPDGSVMIDVNAEKSAFQLTPGTGVPIFTDATNGNVIEAPVKDITTAQTSIRAQTGQTIVLGGMITNETSHVDRRVPFLGDIPIAGHLFRYQQDQMRRKELLIFLTPRIVRSDEDSEAINQIESERIQLPYETAEQMHGPVHGLPNQRGRAQQGTARGHYGTEQLPAGGHSMLPGQPELVVPHVIRPDGNYMPPETGPQPAGRPPGEHPSGEYLPREYPSGEYPSGEYPPAYAPSGLREPSRGFPSVPPGPQSHLPATGDPAQRVVQQAAAAQRQQDATASQSRWRWPLSRR